MAGTFLTFGLAADQFLTERNKREIVNRLKESRPIYDYNYINSLFLYIFDEIYGYKDSISGSAAILWAAILIVYGLLFSFKLIRTIFGYSLPTRSALAVTLMIAVASTFAVVGFFNSQHFIRYSKKLEKKFRVFDNKKLDALLVLLIGAVVFSIITPLLGYLNTLGKLKIFGFSLFLLIGGIAVPLAGAFPLRILHSIPLDPKKGRINIIISILASIAAGLLYILSVSYTFGLVGFNHTTALVSGLTLGFAVLMLPLLLNILRRISVIHPGKAMIFSVLFVIAFSGFFNDPRIRFQNDVLVSGPGILLFPLFNIFADTISLFETRWILKKSKGSKLLLLLSMLLIDLVLSGAIYLILPILVGQDLNVMLQGIFFKQPDPWIGILFWSTYATSLMYYLFLTTIFTLSLIQIPSYVTRVISAKFSIEENIRKSPILFLSCISFIIIVFILMIYSVFLQPILDILTWYAIRDDVLYTITSLIFFLEF